MSLISYYTVHMMNRVLTYYSVETPLFHTIWHSSPLRHNRATNNRTILLLISNTYCFFILTL